jgi:hypothetical protein
MRRQVAHRAAGLTATALLVVALSGVGWWLWTVVGDVPLPEPIRVDEYVRPAPVVFHTDGGGRPDTIAEMVQRADAVVLAKMVSNETDEIRVGLPRYRQFYTGFRFLVIDGVLESPQKGDSITIWRPGQREDREEFYLRPTLGQSFVIFLKHFPNAKGYFPTFGRYGTYEVTDGKLHQLVSHPTTVAYEGKPVDQFLADLRQHAQTERPTAPVR